jgi:hypothetical protein
MAACKEVGRTTDKTVQLWRDQVPFPGALALGPGHLKCKGRRTLQQRSIARCRLIVGRICFDPQHIDSTLENVD